MEQFTKPINKLPKKEVEPIESIKGNEESVERYEKTELVESTIPGVKDNVTGQFLSFNDAVLLILNKVEKLERSLL